LSEGVFSLKIRAMHFPGAGAMINQCGQPAVQDSDGHFYQEGDRWHQARRGSFELLKPSFVKAKDSRTDTLIAGNKKSKGTAGDRPFHGSIECQAVPFGESALAFG